MKCATSSCKGAALRKDLSRFWPVWIGYILCLMVLQMVQCQDEMSYWYAAKMAETIPVMGFVNCVYALVVAAVVFGDLFQPRLCYGIHALPLKREHWFSAHIKAGFLFSLIPTALMTVFSELVIGLYSEMVNGWQIPLYWFAASNIQYVFFFGVASLCVMWVGSRFALTVVYGIVNFFSILILLLVDQLYTPMLHGVVTPTDPFVLLCPMYQILSTRFLDPEQIQTGHTYLDEAGREQLEYIGEFTVQVESWIYILVLAALGVVLILAARRAYKKRNLEAAGDFLAVRWLEPVFQVVFTVLCAAAFHGAFYILFGNSDNGYALIGIGMVAGWFAGRMFLERSTRVFRLKNFAGLVLVALGVAGSLYLTSLDPLGIQTWRPEPEMVERVTINLSHHGEYNTEDPEEIQELIRLHALALEDSISVHPDYADWGSYSPVMDDKPAAFLSVIYKLENGMRVRREYYVLATSEAGQLAREYNSRIEVVFTHKDIQDAEDLRYKMERVDTIYVGSIRVDEKYLTPEFLNALTDALIADCESGALVQSPPYHPEKMLVLDSETDDFDVHNIYLDMHGQNGFYAYLNIYADCENVLAVLEKTNVMDALRSRE